METVTVDLTTEEAIYLLSLLTSAVLIHEQEDSERLEMERDLRDKITDAILER